MDTTKGANVGGRDVYIRCGPTDCQSRLPIGPRTSPHRSNKIFHMAFGRTRSFVGRARDAALVERFFEELQGLIVRDVGNYSEPDYVFCFIVAEKVAG